MATIRQILLSILTVAAGQVEGQASDCRYYQLIEPNTTYYIYNSRYPNYEYRGSTCAWYSYTEPGYDVSLNCPTVDLSRDFNGCIDTLYVSGSSSDGDYCAPFTVQSLNNRLLLLMTISNQSRGGNFVCTVTAKPKIDDCDCGWSYRKKIVGGEETGVNEFPMMASLVDITKRAHVCGATIISRKYVLTAAHCLDVLKVPTTAVLAGEHDFTTGSDTNATALYSVARFIYHPQWTRSTTMNDLGLIETSRLMAFSMRVGPACLPFGRPNFPEVGDKVTAVGWGTLTFGGPVPQKLQKVDLSVVGNQRCQKAFVNKFSPTNQFCTFEKGKDSCQMDSGGPLFKYDVRLFLAGVISYGGPCAGDDPSVSTRVSSYLNWIQAVTQEKFCIK